MKESEMYERAIRLAIAGTGGEISGADFAALEMLFSKLYNERLLEKWQPKEKGDAEKCAQNAE